MRSTVPSMRRGCRARRSPMVAQPRPPRRITAPRNPKRRARAANPRAVSRGRNPSLPRNTSLIIPTTLTTPRRARATSLAPVVMTKPRSLQVVVMMQPRPQPLTTASPSRAKRSPKSSSMIKKGNPQRKEKRVTTLTTPPSRPSRNLPSHTALTTPSRAKRSPKRASLIKKGNLPSRAKRSLKSVQALLQAATLA